MAEIVKEPWPFPEEITYEIFGYFTKSNGFNNNEIFHTYYVLSQVSKEFNKYISNILKDYLKITKVITIHGMRPDTFDHTLDKIVNNIINIYVKPSCNIYTSLHDESFKICYENIIKMKYIMNKLINDIFEKDKQDKQDKQGKQCEQCEKDDQDHFEKNLYENVLKQFIKINDPFYDYDLSDPDTPYIEEKTFNDSIRIFIIKIVLNTLQRFKNNNKNDEIIDINNDYRIIGLFENDLFFEDYQKINKNFPTSFQFGFTEIIRNTKSVVSGSSVLQIILNEHYINSDIDIYTSQINVNDLLHFFINYKATIISMTKTDDDFNEYNKVRFNISHVITIEYQNVKFQIISLTDPFDRYKFSTVNDILYDINDNFDLSFCTTSWDGFNVYFKNSKITKTSLENYYPEFDSDIFELTHKIGTFNVNSEFDLNRIKKYISRGFTINLEEYPTDYFDNSTIDYNSEYEIDYQRLLS
jgi:hypothetical protein